MKIGCAGIIGLLLASLFIGFMVFALPISLFPSLTENTTARLLCEPGTFRVSSRTSDDGHHYTNYKCMDKKGIPVDITFQALAVPGMIASGVIFLLGLAVSLIRGITSPQSSSPAPTGNAAEPVFSTASASIPSTPPAAAHSPQSGSRSQRLQELKDMYDSNLISADDYERKKNEILDQL